MKFSENSLVVDVIKISNSSYKLSVPAGDLLTAATNGAVLRRHDLSTAAVPNVLYVPLSEAKLSSGTYSFKFASGDVFTASSADAYPAASSVSDNTDSELPAIGTSDKNKYLHTNESTGALEWAEGGSGGGLLVVTDTDDTLDKTWQEIHDSAPLVWLTGGDGDYYILGAVYEDDGDFCVTFTEPQPDGNLILLFVATSASGYPVHVKT